MGTRTRTRSRQGFEDPRHLNPPPPLSGPGSAGHLERPSEWGFIVPLPKLFEEFIAYNPSLEPGIILLITQA